MPPPPPLRQFPVTRASIIEALSGDDPDGRERALEMIASAYWGPVRALLCARYGMDEDTASDVTQDFFAAAIERNWFLRYDPRRARFRTFLRTCVESFAAKAYRASRRVKRGGALERVPFDDAVLPAAEDEHIDALFKREWVRGVFEHSLAAFRAEPRTPTQDVGLRLFERYDIEGVEQEERPTYAILAAEFELPATQVTNLLAWARRRFRAHVLETLRGLTGDEAEFRAEARALLGVDEG